MRRRRRVVATLLGFVVLGALVGCVSLPRSGPVTEADPQVRAEDEVVLVAHGPQPDASPMQIVQGFLRALAAAGGDDFAVAREYLAGPTSQTWDPRAQVRVYAERDEISLTQRDDGAVEASVLAAATVDEQGRYTESPPDTTMETSFSLARGTNGQWRIVDLEDGVLLSPAVFEAQFIEQPLYFLSQDQQALVPEIRWFPKHNITTQIVRSLLEGPSSWLGPAVTTAAPAGTRLAVDSVTVVEGVADIDLSPEALGASEDELSLLAAQVQESLRDVQAVRSINITAGGTSLENDADVELLRNPYLTVDPVVLSGEELLTFNGTELMEIEDVEPLDGIEAHDPAQPFEDQPGRWVVLDGEDTLVTVPKVGEPSEVLYRGEDLVPPSIDRHGWVWTGGRNSDGSITAVDELGNSVSVDASWLDGTELLAVRVSRDGARAVVVWREDGGTRLAITAISRDVDATPVALNDPVRLGESLSSITDVAWVDEETVAVLASGDSNDEAVQLMSVGGPTTELPSVDGAEQLTAGTGDRTLLLATEDGGLYERNGLGWTRVLDGAEDPAYPG